MSAPMMRFGVGGILKEFKRLNSLSFARYSSLRQTITQQLSSDGEKESQNLCAEGWVKSVRNHKECVFLHLSDGSSSKFLQVVANPELCRDVTFGSCVAVTGNLVPSPAKGQKVELVASKIDVLGTCNADEFPINYKAVHSPDYLREILHIRPKTNFTGSLLRVRNAATMAIHKYFQENSFCYIHTPILTSNDCEGAGEVFVVEPAQRDLIEKLSSDSDIYEDSEKKKHFFRQPAFLTVSGQLHLEAITGGFSRVYNFGPTLRADNSAGRYHLSEFYMVEAEIAFIKTLEDIMQLVEDLVKFTTKEVTETAAEDVDFFLNSKFNKSKTRKDVAQTILDKPFYRMSYSDAVKCLEKHNNKFKFKVKWGCDLQKEHEKYLVQECGDIPVFVTDYPATLKPFYCRDNEDGCTVSAVDLLVPDVGELVGGSLREERHDIIKDKLDKLDLTQNMQWYLDLRRFGSAPHGGFGLGFERYLQCLLGIYNIKDTIPFPRWPKNCKL